MAYTASTGSDHFEIRLALSANSNKELLTLLQ